MSQDSVLAEQEQTFLPTLSVLETLDVCCMLTRAGYAASAKQAKAATLQSLLSLVGLSSVQHTRVRFCS